jgi:hypothetical protein
MLIVIRMRRRRARSFSTTVAAITARASAVQSSGMVGMGFGPVVASGVSGKREFARGDGFLPGLAADKLRSQDYAQVSAGPR